MTPTGQEITVAHFTDERINDVMILGGRLTPEEREFLVTDTPRFEECSNTAEELRAMTDCELLMAAYFAWADYASGQV